MNCDFVLTGEQQTRKVDVVLLSKETDFFSSDDSDASPGSVPVWSFRDDLIHSTTGDQVSA